MLWEWSVAPCQRDEKPLRKKFKNWVRIERSPVDQHKAVNSPTGTVIFVREDRIIYNLDVTIRGGFSRDEDVRHIEVTTFCMGITDEWENRKDAEMYFLRKLIGAPEEEKPRYLKVYNEIRQGLSICVDKSY